MNKFEDLIYKREAEINANKTSNSKDKANLNKSVALGILYAIIGAISGGISGFILYWVLAFLYAVINIGNKSQLNDYWQPIIIWAVVILGTVIGYNVGYGENREERKKV
jgi:hypothetical protein